MELLFRWGLALLTLGLSLWSADGGGLGKKGCKKPVGTVARSPGYVITTPRKWTVGSKTDICGSLIDAQFDFGDHLDLTLRDAEKPDSKPFRQTLSFTEGSSNDCASFIVPPIQSDSFYQLKATLTLEGILGGDSIHERVNVTLVNSADRIFVQTDKYLYLPGQTVKLRLLTLSGPLVNVSVSPYKVVYVLSPSRTRIYQWLNVQNTDGLMQLEFDLSEEVEEGMYTIMVEDTKGTSAERTFKVEDYVLPRYEVTIEAPLYILGSDENVTLKLCARYTYGEPVNGEAQLSLASGSWRIYANETQTKKIFGCEEFTFPTKDLLFDQNNCHINVNRLIAKALVIEQGTGVEIFGENDNIPVHRTALLFEELSPSSYVRKPYFPYTLEVKARFPDNTPAKHETMEVCTFYEGEERCKNLTTSDEGVIRFLTRFVSYSRIEVKALNYRKLERNWNNVMEDSNYAKYLYEEGRYVDRSNSSLTIYRGEKLQCITGQSVEFNLPVLYYVRGVTKTDLYIQVMSRGKVQYFDKVEVEFTKTNLSFNDEVLLLPLEEVPEDVASGSLEIPLSLPSTVSPKILVLVWYTTEEVVVADSQEIEITECLPHKVDLSWDPTKAEPGSQTKVTIRGEENALCGLGVVDKSVELLSKNHHLSISEVLQSVYQSEVSRWDPNQLNLEYCLAKYNNSLEIAAKETSKNTSGATLESDSPYPYEYSQKWFRIYQDLEALHMFNYAGYFVLTDLVVQKLFCEKSIVDALKALEFQNPDGMFPRPPPPMGGAGGGFEGDSLPAPQLAFTTTVAEGSPSKETAAAPKEKPSGTNERTYLPETWLWQLTRLSSTGESSEVVRLPDTITEWVGRALCVHPSQGVGISYPSSVVTFTPFFTDLTLPASIKRGEILPLKVSIFNYLEEDLPVRLTLEPSSEYEFVSEGGIPETGIRKVCITTKEKRVEIIKMRFTAFGKINITVEATADANAVPGCGSGVPPAKKDRLKKPMQVDAEGYLRERTWTRYICSQDIKDPTVPVGVWKVEVPNHIVNGSARGWITAAGDLMGPTLENIGNLVNMPYGCGEQNMVNFSPNIYILQYLDASEQTTPEIRDKIISYLNYGYQRELRYKHSDGSFSAFGEYDASGSTWLTAFVVKSFAGAKSYILIDDDVLLQSLTYLQNKQNKETGCFISEGRVLSKMLQGGLTSGGNAEVLLSSYVLAALLEAQMTSKDPEFRSKDLDAAVTCIEKDDSDHPYSLALRAYALALAKAPSAKAVIDKLMSIAVSNASELRWDLGDKNLALGVETASYALLALVRDGSQGNAEPARKIVRWISAQRNGQGGFISTQDTVVALQALAAFENSQPKDPVNMEVKGRVQNVDGTYGNDVRFKVTEDNKFLQQMAFLRPLPKMVSFTLSGSGCTLIQGVLRYNVLTDSPNAAFILNVSAIEDKGAVDMCRSRRLGACTSYTLPDGASNMAILEFKLQSGYIPVKDDLKKVLGDGKGIFKRYEVDGNMVTFYLEQVTSEVVCAEFGIYQEVEISNLKPGTVSVYDYYQPEYKTTQKYAFPEMKCNSVV